MIQFSGKDPRWSFTTRREKTLSIRNIDEQLFILDGAKMKTWPELMHEFETAMSFPSYFGRNIPALTECLQDLEWLSATSYRIMIDNACKILSRCSKDDQQTFFFLLNRISLEWASGSLPGANWHRDETAFRVVLQGKPSCLDDLKMLLEKVLAIS